MTCVLRVQHIQGLPKLVAAVRRSKQFKSEESGAEEALFTNGAFSSKVLEKQDLKCQTPFALFKQACSCRS